MTKEGTEVRRAHDGPDIDHDEMIDFSTARNREDRERASSAGESRQKIGGFLEKTGMNSQAFSWCRSILKKLDKNEGQAKAMDIISSLRKALPMVEAHVRGQGTAEMFPEANEVEQVPFDEPAAEEKPKAKRTRKKKAEEAAPESDPESDAFDSAAAEVYGEDGEENTGPIGLAAE